MRENRRRVGSSPTRSTKRSATLLTYKVGKVADNNLISSSCLAVEGADLISRLLHIVGSNPTWSTRKVNPGLQKDSSGLTYFYT